MFPSNNSGWTSYIISNNNEINPCSVDIVGNSTYPGTYYYFDPTGNPTEVGFRMRLNGNPIKNNPNQYVLDEFVWGVDIKDASDNLLFTVMVNASGNTYNLQVTSPSSPISLYDVPILLHNPPQASDNVRVITPIDSQFPCANKADDDYFLDFKVPTNAFPNFNFLTSTYRFCYFTATQDNVRNKEYTCGSTFNPPQHFPKICAHKDLISGPTTVCLGVSATWVYTVTVTNCGNVDLTDVTLTDAITNQIDISSITILPSVGPVYNPVTRTITWHIGNLAINTTQILTITVTGRYLTPGLKIFNTGNVTAKYDSAAITPASFQDSGVDVIRCENPERGIQWKYFKNQY